MAQRQFRSDDTSKWRYGFGNGSDGALVVSADTQFSTPNAGCFGTINTKAITLDSTPGFANGDLVLIHQTTGSNAGVWELNRIASGGATLTPTLLYNLTNTYVDGGNDQAQIIKLKQYSSVTINSGKTLSAPDWNGNIGGLLFFLCIGSVAGPGKIAGNGAVGSNGTPASVGSGFRGGTGRINISSPASRGDQGEGTATPGTTSTAANSNGGGGGSSNTSAADGGSGGGGGNGTAGASGSTQGTATAGAGGNTSGNANLTNGNLGGGGGGGAHGGGVGGNGGAGGSGGAFLGIFGATITNTLAVEVKGGQGVNTDRGGGGGGGGSLLFKCRTAVFGAGLVVGTGGIGAGFTPGGNGGDGIIHVDYLTSVSGTTNPVATTTQDSTLHKTFGAAAAAFL